MEIIDVREFDRQWVFAQYELGRPVTEIAAEMKKSEAFVYGHLRSKPDKYEDIKRIREEQYNMTLRRVRGLADTIMLSYLESMRDKLDNPDLSDEERDAVFEQIDQVAKIAKLYADRINLAEGKATENIALNHNGKIPFEIIITKAYENEELPAASEQLPEDGTENEEK